MKLRYLIRLLVLGLMIHTLGLISVDAYHRYDTESVFGQERTELMREISDFMLADSPETERMFKCFAISDEGKIALAFDGEFAQIDVYSADGTYLYGYTFQNRNCAFSVFYEGETLSVYHAKGNFIASFDAYGNCVRVFKAPDSKANSEAYHNDFYRPSSGQIGNLSYVAEKTLSLTKYGRFTVIDALGNEVLIYEVSNASNVKNVLSVISFAGIAVVLWFGVRKYKREFITQDNQ